MTTRPPDKDGYNLDHLSACAELVGGLTRKAADWLIARVRELEADKRRLDWLAEHGSDVCHILGWYKPGIPDDLRQAIDLAMRTFGPPITSESAPSKNQTENA